MKRKFEEYYEANSAEIVTPPQMEKREYGFLLFKENVMLRHRSFNSVDELRRFVLQTVPSDIYNSAAYYSHPEEEMTRKDWQGSDLIFDVDADHIATPCKSTHDSWKCKDCESGGMGIRPERCPRCGCQKIEEAAWLCEICLEKAKDEIIKLTEILEDDLGLSAGDTTVVFSGHRGYHAHVRSADVIGLGEAERREIVDYILGTGIDLALLGLARDRGQRMRARPVTELDNHGWRGRLARGAYEIMGRSSLSDVVQLGLRRSSAEKFIENKDAIMAQWLERATWEPPRNFDAKSWTRVIQAALDLKAAKIDTVVTTDIHRLIRVPGTLNGKTGLRAVEVEKTKLEAFDPLKESLAVVGEETVYVKEAPEFRLGDSTFGPFKEATVVLPSPHALLLICKGKALPAQ